MKTAIFLAATAALIGYPLASVHAQEENSLLAPIIDAVPSSTPAADSGAAADMEPVPQKIEIPTDAIDSSARVEEESNAILPENSTLPPTPENAPASAAALKKGTAEQLRQAARIRELKTLSKTDPEIQAQLAAEQTATTPEGHRTALRNYYTLLYRKIAKLDPSVESVAIAELRGKLTALEQSHIRPSTLIEAIKPVPGSNVSDLGPAPHTEEEKDSSKHGKKHGHKHKDL